MRSQSPVTDEEFRSWVEPLLDAAAGYAYSFLHNREDAEDAVQEALLRAYRGRNRHDRSRSLKAWWFAIVRNCCLDLLRKRKRQPTFLEADESLLPDNADERDTLHDHDALHWAIDQLSPEHREIIQLRYFGECTYAEIASALQIPAGTVMSRLHAARKFLAAVYRKEMK
jgi:RNA polymerase sigma-70 factor (ECF subfamily)